MICEADSPIDEISPRSGSDYLGPNDYYVPLVLNDLNLPKCHSDWKHSTKVTEVPVQKHSKSDDLMKKLNFILEAKSAKIVSANNSQIADIKLESMYISQSDSFKSNKSGKQTRWNRENDRELFKYLNEYLEEAKLDLSEFSSGYVPEYNDIIAKLSYQLGWQRSIMTLYDRIVKVAKDSQSFSTRNLKKFKKTISTYSEISDDDFKNILYEFPGMTIEQLKAKAGELRHS